ncbi:LOW QUALITY PROTEIN: probable disease resistance protein At1g12290 [Asparagus officinalis]|uniref:LOW QUALITY PROTEIN: probable disease resistance protein At1g12290 n=1 Tax=Asparagus officinalis TaxID=4686 RepID=UPI00098E0456|nr:LOW QUALITY PROTEIN: probable disease resistance protein At1g12290 [Asparagus officinalis]
MNILHVFNKLIVAVECVISVISAVGSPIIGPIVTLSIEEAKYLLNTEANVAKLREAYEELSLTKEEVLQQIATDTSKSDEIVPTKRVKTWKRDVESREADISRILEAYRNRATYFGGRCPRNCWSSYRISKRAARAAEGARELVRKKENFPKDRVTEKRAPRIRRVPTLTSDATADSTDRYLKVVFGYLQDEEVGMVGIWGMGGVGKTTLLQKINNHPDVASAGFDYVILLAVSQVLDLDRLQKETAERLGLPLEEGTSTLDSRIRRYLSNKSFLLLLDNVWDPLELERLGIPHPTHGSSSSGTVPKRKVLFTTRSENLSPGCRKLIKIKCLKQEEAWNLFLHNVGEGTRTVINTDERVCSRAEKVAEKCGGLPLAIVLIARAMSANKTWQEWEVAVNSLERIGIQEMWSKGEDPFPLLKVSYDRLPDDNVKNCFLSCALWQGDRALWDEGEFDLINFWLSMNVIDGDLTESDHKGSESYLNGYANLQNLKRACLLEEVQGFSVGLVKMHDVIRGMALWIISECKKEWVIIDQTKRKNESDGDGAGWTSRDDKMIRLIHGRPGTQLPQHPDCPTLSALILGGNHIDMIPERFFQNMNALTCLICHLTTTSVKLIPAAIGRLQHLRYLDLSYTDISSLPVELGDLIQLRCLLVNVSFSLRSIPHGLIPRLEKLAQLELFGSAFNAWGTEGQASIEELVLSGITSLSIDVRRLDTLEQLSKNRLLSLWRVVITELEDVTSLPLRRLLRNGRYKLPF